MKKLCYVLLILSMLIPGMPVFSNENTGVPSHVIINQVYGGGDLGKVGTPVSHSFIELYNPTNESADINGWSVQYSQSGSKWKVLRLSGEIPPRHSYLIRCGAHDINAGFKITEYDKSWNIGLNNKGLKVLLKSNGTAAQTENPYASGENGYIDMVGVAGNEKRYLIDGCETDYAQIQSKQKSVRRTEFKDTDNNAKDFSAIDYRTADLEEIRPRSLKDGEWTFSEFVRTKKTEKVMLPDKSGEFTFLHVSDTQASTKGQFEIWGQLAKALKNIDYDFTVHTGDITDNPDNEQEMDMFYEYSGDIMKKPFIPVVGNHDMKINTEAKLYEEYFGKMPGTQAPYPVKANTTASFDYGNAHFIVLNSEDDLTVQAQWLEKELEKTDKKWKIVAMHRAPYGAVGTNDTIIFASLFDKYNVDLVIHGHDHLYARTYPLYNGRKTAGGTVYLESGSSGVKQEIPIVKQSYHEVMISPQEPSFSEITVKENEIYVEAKALEDGKLKGIDTFSIKKYSGEMPETIEKQSEPPKEYFSDIRMDRPYRDAVILLSKLGIIGKTVSFMPNDEITGEEFDLWLSKASGNVYTSGAAENITPAEAVKEILNRLGYGAYIEASGADYKEIAADIGLYRNIGIDENGILKRSDAAQLIANALEAYIINTVGVSNGGVEYEQIYSSWLNTVFGVYKMTGIITDRPYYTETSADKLVKFTNTFGEELTAVCSEEVYPLLGYEISAYIKDPYDGGEMLCGVKTKRNKELTVKKSWYGEIPSVGNYINFTYTNDENKTYKAAIDKEACFVYNEALSEATRQKVLSRTKNAFKPSHIGQITLVDNNGDKVYDYVFIDNYKDMVVAGINTEKCTVTNKLAYIDGVSVKQSKYTEIPKISLDINDTSYKTSFLTPEDEPSSFGSITKNCVISVALSSMDDEDPETALVRRVYVSNLSTVGTVESVFEEDEDDYFVVNGKAYRASKSYYNTYNGGESTAFSNIRVGKHVALYLDYDERIAYIAADNTGVRYGLLIDRAEKADSIGNMGCIKLIDAKGDEKEYEISEDNYKKFGIKNMTLPQPLEFREENGIITSIDLSLKLEQSGVMQYSDAGNRIGNYFCGSNTLMYLYRGEKNDGGENRAERYSVASPDILKNNGQYFFEIYEVNNYYSPSAAVVYRGKDFPIGDDDDICFVADIINVINKSGVAVKKIYAFSEGRQIELEFEEDETVFPKEGDIIQYRKNADGAIENWRLLCSGESGEFEINTVFDEVFFGKYSKLTASDENILTFEFEGKNVNHIYDDDTVIYSITKNRNFSVAVGTADDIAVENNTFIIAREGIASEIFVWEND